MSEASVPRLQARQCEGDDESTGDSRRASVQGGGRNRNVARESWAWVGEAKGAFLRRGV